jgi:hypothetical protein
MNAIPWVMTHLLADEHRRDLEATAARRRRLVTEGARSGRSRFHRRHHRDV